LDQLIAAHCPIHTTTGLIRLRSVTSDQYARGHICQRHALSSDGIEPHSHGGFGPHQHGKPKFTDEEVAVLEGRGYHVDRHHEVGFDYRGHRVSPCNVAAMLRGTRTR
jgi:hypothetical protein